MVEVKTSKYQLTSPNLSYQSQENMKTKKLLLLALTALTLTSPIQNRPAVANETTSVEAAVQTAVEQAGEQPAVVDATNRIIITYAKDQTAAGKEAALTSVQETSPLINDIEVIKEEVAIDPNTVVVETDTVLTLKEAEELTTQLTSDPRIVEAEPDRLVKAVTASATTEPFYPRLWAYSTTYLNAPPAWASGYTGKGIEFGG